MENVLEFKVKRVCSTWDSDKSRVPRNNEQNREIILEHLQLSLGNQKSGRENLNLMIRNKLMPGCRKFHGID